MKKGLKQQEQDLAESLMLWREYHEEKERVVGDMHKLEQKNIKS